MKFFGKAYPVAAVTTLWVPAALQEKLHQQLWKQPRQSGDAGDVQLHPQWYKLLKPARTQPTCQGQYENTAEESKGSGGVQGIGFGKVMFYITLEDLKHWNL